MTLSLIPLDTPVGGGAGSLVGNTVTPLPNALVVIAVTGYDRAFLSDPTPIPTDGWGGTAWASPVVMLTGGQVFFSWTHELVTALMWGRVSATPTAGTWGVFHTYNKAIAGIWQVVNAGVPADAGQGSADIAGFLGLSGLPVAASITATLSRTPKTSSLVVAVNGSTANTGSWTISDPAGFTNVFSADSPSSSDPDYGNFTHTHLQVASRQGGGDTLTWGLPSGATSAGIALEIVETVPPRLRQFPRDDSLGHTPRPRRESSSVQATIRQGWQGTYR